MHIVSEPTSVKDIYGLEIHMQSNPKYANSLQQSLVLDYRYTKLCLKFGIPENIALDLDWDGVLANSDMYADFLARQKYPNQEITDAILNEIWTDIITSHKKAKIDPANYEKLLDLMQAGKHLIQSDSYNTKGGLIEKLRLLHQEYKFSTSINTGGPFIHVLNQRKELSKLGLLNIGTSFSGTKVMNQIKFKLRLQRDFYQAMLQRNSEDKWIKWTLNDIQKDIDQLAGWQKEVSNQYWEQQSNHNFSFNHDSIQSLITKSFQRSGPPIIFISDVSGDELSLKGLLNPYNSYAYTGEIGWEKMSGNAFSGFDTSRIIRTGNDLEIMVKRRISQLSELSAFLNNNPNMNETNFIARALNTSENRELRSISRERLSRFRNSFPSRESKQRSFSLR